MVRMSTSQWLFEVFWVVERDTELILQNQYWCEDALEGKKPGSWMNLIIKETVGFETD